MKKLFKQNQITILVQLLEIFHLFLHPEQKTGSVFVGFISTSCFQTMNKQSQVTKKFQ